MVVDPSPLQGQAFEHIIKKNRPDISYVGQVFSGKAGIELAQQTHADIVFAEIYIAGTDGLSMARKLKELLPQILVVVLTVMDDFCLVDKALRIGVNDYLLKPISQKDLLSVIDNLIDLNSNSRPIQPQHTDPLPAYYKDLLKLFKTGTIEQIFNLTDVIVSELSIKTDRELNQIRSQLINIATEITSAEQNANLNGVLTIVYKEFLSDIIKAQQIECLLSSFNNYIQKSASLYNQEDHSYRFEVISRIQEIIEFRLNDNITLESIAAEMYFTPSYLSRLFKKEIGKNFSDYLIDRRLEKAKILLLSTNRTIDSIAQETGYENANSFRRLFKSKIGMSATEYRSVNQMSQ
ncbi:MAG: helix-turn-helix domain-containing protein [Syntrophomonadaceae bacterium]|nr:helix-turn-helix domain-containing protein [Syntrophomonadaceae bacterium]